MFKGKIRQKGWVEPMESPSSEAETQRGHGHECPPAMSGQAGWWVVRWTEQQVAAVTRGFQGPYTAEDLTPP